jgi:predicted amidohydrolase YtcJ
MGRGEAGTNTAQRKYSDREFSGAACAVGGDADVLHLATAGSKKIDVGRKTVLQGFIDAHSHPAMAGVMHLRMVDCDLRSISAIQASDYPPGEFIPMMALQSEVTRTDMKGNVWGPKQKITAEGAIRVGTINGAYASYEENLQGSLEAGKVADLVVLGRDPLNEDPSSLVSTPVERTMAGGRRRRLRSVLPYCKAVTGESRKYPESIIPSMSIA